MEFVKCEYGLNDDCMLFKIKVIINELLINAIVHGNKCQLDKSVGLTLFQTDNKYLGIMVEDEGGGFNHQCLTENCNIECSCLDEAKETGRGMLIVKHLSEKLSYNEKGNKVTALVLI
ncbi:MAG: ATP-binding protein [Eubacteriales bacterium]|nr:ATP-binding protein [Eubacteriales bacterium]